jgi:hypothetical protein
MMKESDEYEGRYDDYSCESFTCPDCACSFLTMADFRDHNCFDSLAEVER